MSRISAVILAAGRSTRMGAQKLLMPWGNMTVIGKVISTLRAAGITDIVLVTNSALAEKIANDDVNIVVSNNDEMLESLKAGLRAMQPSAEAALVCLGDQPQVEEGTVRSVSEAFHKSGARLVIPSYDMRRGHPWLAARTLWNEIQALSERQTLRDFLNLHANEIEYVSLNTPTVLQDLDTPEDYLKYKPPM